VSKRTDSSAYINGVKRLCLEFKPEYSLQVSLVNEDDIDKWIKRAPNFINFNRD
jgi:hypothetical protein